MKIKNHKNKLLHVSVYEKSKKNVFILFHGMFSHSENKDIKQTKDFLLKNGYSVISFDYSGHGKSQGSFAELNISHILKDKDKIISYAKKHFKNIFLLSFSFGAYPVLMEASINKKLKGIILFNPATNMPKLVFRKKTQTDLDNYTKGHRSVNFYTKIFFLIDSLKYNLYKKSKKIKCPIYVYHISNDLSVSFNQSKRLEQNIKSKHKFIYPLGSDHSLEKELNNDEFSTYILPNAINWIKKNI